jgi:opacity protein-like surface antigen
MKHPRLSTIFAAVTAVSLVLASSAGMAAKAQSYKGENFKGEVPPPCPPIMMLHDGFYVGAGVGYDSYKFDNTTDITLVDAAVPTTILGTTHSSVHQAATGWMGGLFVGYGHYWDWFYLGAEINANTSGAENSSTWSDDDGDSITAKIKARTSYGIGVLPGIKVNDSTLLYARIGYLRTNFKGSATVSDNTSGIPTTVSVSESEWRNGWNYGVGIETYVAEDVSVRGEYTYTALNSTKDSASFTDPTLTYTLNATSKFKPSNNEFMLSLLYHFA